MALRVVILAAGRGERLLPFTQRNPKPLIPICGRPLLEHVIYAFKHAGVEDFIVVTGYLGNVIQRYFGDGAGLNVKIRYAHNPAYTCGNGTSLLATKDFFTKDEAFLLSMSDHLIDASIAEKALQSFEHRPLLCVDRQPRFPPQVKDATKVLMGEDGYIKDIGKSICRWNAVDTGVFLLTNAVFEVIKGMEERTGPLTLSRCIKRLIEIRHMWACDVSGFFWLDIDTCEDLDFVRRRLKL